MRLLPFFGGRQRDMLTVFDAATQAEAQHFLSVKHGFRVGVALGNGLGYRLGGNRGGVGETQQGRSAEGSDRNQQAEQNGFPEAFRAAWRQPGRTFCWKHSLSGRVSVVRS
ncbi:MAG: hypothetical protein IPK39_01280 [Sulfuritalea sp.]|nr:hypothetical protein [Sulfuritalea sp.]